MNWKGLDTIFMVFFRHISGLFFLKSTKETEKIFPSLQTKIITDYFQVGTDEIVKPTGLNTENVTFPYIFNCAIRFSAKAILIYVSKTLFGKEAYKDGEL